MNKKIVAHLSFPNARVILFFEDFWKYFLNPVNNCDLIRRMCSIFVLLFGSSRYLALFYFNFWKFALNFGYVLKIIRFDFGFHRLRRILR